MARASDECSRGDEAEGAEPEEPPEPPEPRSALPPDPESAEELPAKADTGCEGAEG